MERTKFTERNEFGLPNIVIPAEVLMNTNLTPREMILFGYLLNMTYNEQGCCWASNRYLSRLIKVAPETVSAMISKLTKEQYLILEYETRYDGKETRRIFINKKYPEIYNETLKQRFQELKVPIRNSLRDLKENLNAPKGKTQDPISESLSNIDIDIDKVDNLGSKEPSDPAGRNGYIPSDEAIQILEYWGNLSTKTTQHRTSSKTYKQACQMIDQLLTGKPIAPKPTKEDQPIKPLLNFCTKHNIDTDILHKQWTAQEICKILQLIDQGLPDDQKYGLQEVLWNKFATGGSFSYFLHKADQKQVPERYANMADKLATAVGTTLSEAKRIDWAKEFQELLGENGKTDKQVDAVLDWYMKNYDYPMVKSVRGAQEFCDYFHKISKSMQIKETPNTDRPRSKPTQAIGRPAGKQYPC